MGKTRAMGQRPRGQHQPTERCWAWDGAEHREDTGHRKDTGHQRDADHRTDASHETDVGQGKMMVREQTLATAQMPVTGQMPARADRSKVRRGRWPTLRALPRSS